MGKSIVAATIQRDARTQSWVVRMPGRPQAVAQIPFSVRGPAFDQVLLFMLQRAGLIVPGDYRVFWDGIGMDIVEFRSGTLVFHGHVSTGRGRV